MRFGEKFGGSSGKIVELIFGDQYISASEMAEIIGITERAVEKQLARLKEKNVIERIGPEKAMYLRLREQKEQRKGLLNLQIKAKKAIFVTKST